MSTPRIYLHVSANVNVHEAVVAVLMRHRRIAGFRDAAALLPSVDVHAFDDLRESAIQALLANQGLNRFRDAQEATDRRVVAAMANARAITKVLRATLAALTISGVVAESSGRRIRSDQSYAGTVTDLHALCMLLGGPGVVRSPMTGAHLASAKAAADELQNAIAARQLQGDARRVRLERDVAFNRFAANYAEVRRAIAMLVANKEEAEEVAPSLYRRGSRRTPSESARVMSEVSATA